MITSSPYHKSCHEMYSKLDVKVDSYPIQSVTHHKYLGVTIDNHLSWSSHIDAVASKASQRFVLLRLSKRFLLRQARLTFYTSLVRPLLEYSSVAWGNCSRSVFRKLETIESYATRLITDSPPRTRTSPLLKRLNLPRLKDRLDYFQALLIHRCVHHRCPKFLDDLVTLRSPSFRYPTRSCKLNVLMLPFPRTNYLKNVPCYRAAKIWNSLSQIVTGTSSQRTFKKLYRKLYLTV